MTSESELIFVENHEVGERLDKLLSRRFEGHFSRSYFQSLIAEGLVLVNGVPVKKRQGFDEGAEIEICFRALPSADDLLPEDIPLSILYEDQDILVIDKPQGMVIHPAVGHYTGTLVNALLFHHQGIPFEEEGVRPGIVHRLDKDTSGVLVTAKTRESQAFLIEEFSSRRVDKEYLAICAGNPSEGEVVASLGRDPRDRKKMAVVPEGKTAHTLFRTLEINDDLSLVSLSLLTGRTHQIRVHMKHVGHPVLGDPVYGFQKLNQKWGIDQQALHSYSLTFSHPRTKEHMTFKAPYPEHMKRIQFSCVQSFKE